MGHHQPPINREAYLLEEVLPGLKTDFVKYLHNASAASELSSDDPDYQLAQFLMFIQHVQYAITGGIAYVSDFQGNVPVLHWKHPFFCVSVSYHFLFC